MTYMSQNSPFSPDFQPEYNLKCPCGVDTVAHKVHKRSRQRIKITSGSQTSPKGLDKDFWQVSFEAAEKVGKCQLSVKSIQLR